MEVTGPGTAPNGRPSFTACRAVLSAPERKAASTTTVPRARAAIKRLRVRNRARVGAEPGGSSLTISPELATCSNTCALPRGYKRSAPPANIETVKPSTARAARCAVMSIPYAPPETIVNSRSHSSVTNCAVTSSPYDVEARAPTTATERSKLVARLMSPRIQSQAGQACPRSFSASGQALSCDVNTEPSKAASARMSRSRFTSASRGCQRFRLLSTRLRVGRSKLRSSAGKSAPPGAECVTEFSQSSAPTAPSTSKTAPSNGSAGSVTRAQIMRANRSAWAPQPAVCSKDFSVSITGSPLQRAPECVTRALGQHPYHLDDLALLDPPGSKPPAKLDPPRANSVFRYRGIPLIRVPAFGLFGVEAHRRVFHYLIAMGFDSSVFVGACERSRSEERRV